MLALVAPVIAGPLPLDQPLKDQYELYYGLIQAPAGSPGTPVLRKTGDVGTAPSFICDVGKPIPTGKRKFEYYFRPIEGLTLELRARAIKRSGASELRAMGWVVFVKNGQVIKTFDPAGQMSDGRWKGNILNSWAIDETKISVGNGLEAEKGLVLFDVMDGQGFHFDDPTSPVPSWQLQDCRRIQKQALPIYEVTFRGM